MAVDPGSNDVLAVPRGLGTKLYENECVSGIGLVSCLVLHVYIYTHILNSLIVNATCRSWIGWDLAFIHMESIEPNT